MLVEYLRCNMRVAAMPSQKDVCVQTIRTRIARGFAKLTERLDAIYEVEGFDILDMFHELTAKIQEIAPPAPKKSGRKLKPTLEGYARIFSYESLFTGYRNTLLYTVVGTAINVVLTVTAGYALSRKELVGRNVMMMGVMFTMIFSGGMIPNYLLVRDLNLYNTMWALILPGAVSTWNLIVCRTFFQQTIPDELKEAAELDGCGDTSFFLRIVLPVSSAIIAVMILFYAVSHWNSYYNALLYLTSTNKYPLQLVLRNILIVNTLDDMVNDVATQAAQQRMGDLIKYGMIIISSLPLLILYPFLQKFFVHGVMIGAIKG